MPSSSRHYLLSMVAEFTRAIAAAHRYEALRYRSAPHERIAPDEIPRRIFEDFYSVEEAAESRLPVSGRSELPEPGIAKASS